MCLSFRQLHFNYDNSLVKTNANNNRTLPFKGINFLFLFCFPSAGSALKAASSLLTPDCLHPPPKATPIHILTNTGLRLISSHTYLSTPNTPDPAPLANHFKGRCYLPEKKLTEANPSWDPNCSSQTEQTEL